MTDAGPGQQPPARAGTAEELDRARQALTVAYLQARASGYRPDSTSMAALQQAERSYQQARQAHRLARLGSTAPPGSVEIDLRDDPAPAQLRER